MNFLSQTQICLNSNPNLSKEMKDRFYKLVEILNKKIPEVNLIKLNEKLRTVKLVKLSIFEKKGTYFYDVIKNQIKFSNNLDDNYDIDNLLIKAFLEMATSTNTYTGFESDERLKTLNLAYTEILANFVIGNEGESDLEEEMLVANLLSHIIGKDTLFNCYFTNDGMPIIRALQDAEVA